MNQNVSFRRDGRKDFFISNPETNEAVPCFGSVQEYKEGLEARREFEPIDLYHRDGTVQLCETEADMAALARVDAREAVLFNSGMTAVKAALSTATRHKEGEAYVVAHARELYGQSLAHLHKDVRLSGARLISFDSGDPESVENVLEKHQPNIILAETIGNGPNVPVLDVAAFSESVNTHTPDAFVILDNTLPLSTALPLNEQLEQHENMLVVESATKSYTFNREMAGLLYGRNPDIVRTAREVRVTGGGRPGVASTEFIQSLLPDTLEDFDARNKKLYKNTGELAIHLFAAEQQGADFIVSHPLLESHPNHRYATEHYPDGGSPLLYLQCTGEADQFELKDRLWQHPAVQQHAELGQSFGFDTTRILADGEGAVVRVSAGAHTDTEALGTALKEAALNK